MMISFLIILGLYITLCYYIGVKGKKAILRLSGKFKKKKYCIAYWVIYWSIASAYIASNALIGFLGTENLVISIIKVIGVTYLAAFIYLILTFFTADMLKFVIKKINIRVSIKDKMKKLYFSGVSIFMVVAILISFGVWNAQDKVVTNYEINIDKYSGGIASLNIVMISDVHMGIGVKEKGVSKMVDSINELNPDIVLFGGDIFDENTPESLKEYSREAFKNIKSKYGVYDITGNHEYGAGDLSETISYFEGGSVKVLQDASIKVADSFYIVGRNDPANKRIPGQQVKPLSEVLKDVDKSLPIIVLNHRPEQLEEAEAEKVDLQLSGHTHKGQLFPGNLITNYIYEKDYGYLRKNNFNLIVSSGYGTWGPPVRIGSKSEIVNIVIHFKNKPV